LLVTGNYLQAQTEETGIEPAGEKKGACIGIGAGFDYGGIWNLGLTYKFMPDKKYLPT
jgi:hypothetical protein